MMNHQTLDGVVRDALQRLVTDLNTTPWRGRERELVSLFAFEHLIAAGAAAEPAIRRGQIGIEVAVPQHPPHGGKRRNPDVCKDVVIWPEPRRTLWNAKDDPSRYPLAVIEWKTLNNVGIRESPSKKRKVLERDIAWMQAATERAPTLRGYCVWMDLRESPFTLHCVPVANGRSDAPWEIRLLDPITATFPQKRTEWLEALAGPDTNSIIQQLLRMSWDIAAFRVINEARRLAPIDERDSSSIALNPMLLDLLDRGFFDRQLLAIRRLTDPGTLHGKRGTLSLTALVEDMLAGHGMFTRQTVIAAESEPQPSTRVHPSFVEMRHEHIDRLCGTTAHTREGSDAIPRAVFENLRLKLRRARKFAEQYVNKFIAHAASPGSRATVNADEIAITVDGLLSTHREICEVYAFIAIYVLWDSCPGFVPTPQYNQFRNLDKAVARPSDMSKLKAVWEAVDSECNGFSQWGIDEYLNEFGM